MTIHYVVREIDPSQNFLLERNTITYLLNHILWYRFENNLDQLARALRNDQYCIFSNNQIEKPVFTQMMSKKVLNLRQYSSSIVFACPLSFSMIILFSSQQYLSPAVTEKQGKKSEKKTGSSTENIANETATCSVLHAITLRYCRLFVSLANSWRAVTCTVVVSGFAPTSAWKLSLFWGPHAINVQKAIGTGLKRESTLLLHLLHLRMRHSGFVQPRTGRRWPSRR